MAIEFEEEKKKQKYLIGVAVAILLITSVILWRGYFSEVELPEKETASTSTQPQFSIESLPQIDFNILEANILEELNTYPSIEGIDEEEIGRENPFLPY